MVMSLVICTINWLIKWGSTPNANVCDYVRARAEGRGLQQDKEEEYHVGTMREFPICNCCLASAAVANCILVMSEKKKKKRNLQVDRDYIGKKKR